MLLRLLLPPLLQVLCVLCSGAQVLVVLNSARSLALAASTAVIGVAAAAGAQEAGKPLGSCKSAILGFANLSNKQLRKPRVWGGTLRQDLEPQLRAWAVEELERQRKAGDDDQPGGLQLLLTLERCANTRCTNVSGCSEGRLRGRRCSGCAAVRYCSQECQREDWHAGHGRVCSALAALQLPAT